MKSTPTALGGAPDSNTGPITIGILQNVSLDFSFDFAQLYSGSGLFPVDVRVHTGSINGQAETAELTSLFFQLMTGGTLSAPGSTLTLTNVTEPTSWQLDLTLATDSVDMNFTLNACRSASFNVPYARDSHVIPGFQFQAFADSSDNIGTIVMDDPS